jgi:cytoskeleton protein RodZ
LLRARKEQQLYLEDIATRLHLAPGIVEALEQDDFASLPAPTYVRGYLRAYAAILGVSANELIAAYNSHTAEESTPLKLDAAPVKPGAIIIGQDHKRLWLLAAATIVMLLVVVLLMLLADGEEKTANMPSSATTAKPVGHETAARPERPAGSETAVLPGNGKASNARPATAVHPSGPVAEPAPEKPAATAVARTGKAGSARKKATAVGSGSDIITIRFHEASWVVIRDANGKRLLYRTAKPGSSYRLRGQKPFKVYLGNAPGVSMSLNGKPVDLKPFTRRSKTARLNLGK